MQYDVTKIAYMWFKKSFNYADSRTWAKSILHSQWFTFEPMDRKESALNLVLFTYKLQVYYWKPHPSP